MEQWKKRGFFPDGIYTGFLSDDKQADRILKFMDAFAGKDTLILTDPVMGDDGAVYPIYTEELRSRFCELTRRSYVITPNLTEALLLLYGKEKMEEIWNKLQKVSEARRMEEIREIGCGLARKFSLPAVVITGVDHREEGQPLKMGNLVLENGNSSWVFAEKSGGSYSGTGKNYRIPDREKRDILLPDDGRRGDYFLSKHSLFKNNRRSIENQASYLSCCL